MKGRSILGGALAVAASLVLAGTALAAGFTNGVFAPSTPTTFSAETVGAPYTGQTVLPANTIPDWNVTKGNVDWIGSYWQAPPAWPGQTSAPANSIDLNGFTTGAISQTFNTTLNSTHVVQFYLSGNPDPNSICDSMGLSDCYSLANKTGTVGAAGTAAQEFAFDTSLHGNTRDAMGWVQASAYSFVASSTSTTLTFTSTTSGAFGPVIGNVTVTETAATGAMCKDGGWKTMYDENGALFKNQGDCVSFYATSGAVPIGS